MGSMRVPVDPQQTAVKMYVIAGPGAYYVYQNPGAAGAVRPGVSAGGGVSTRGGSRSTVFVEARYHRLLTPPGPPPWLVPLPLRFTLLNAQPGAPPPSPPPSTAAPPPT